MRITATYITSASPRASAAVGFMLVGVLASVLMSGSASAASPSPDAAGEAKPLLQELLKPKYSQSRCMLPPVLAANGRKVVKSADPLFMAGDTVLAVDADVLDESRPTALIDILEQRAPDAVVNVSLRRVGVQRVVPVPCADVKPYYGALREGAQAAVADDATACADRLDAAARLHGLSTIWLRLSLTCKIESGRLAGDALWRAEYELFAQRIAEAQYTPALLRGLRHAVHGAVRDLKHHGNGHLANELAKQYTAAALSDAAARRDHSGVPADD